METSINLATLRGKGKQAMEPQVPSLTTTKIRTTHTIPTSKVVMEASTPITTLSTRHRTTARDLEATRDKRVASRRAEWEA